VKPVGEATATGTHEGTWAGIAPTGRRLRVRAGCLFDFDGGRLIGEKLYFDLETVMRQLGL
jgi:predicted ester cyclase